MVEAVAKALAEEEWEATSFAETLSGQDPEEMREYWRDKARIAIRTVKAVGAMSQDNDRGYHEIGCC
jgi:hypothetical protein